MRSCLGPEYHREACTAIIFVAENVPSIVNNIDLEAGYLREDHLVILYGDSK